MSETCIDTSLYILYMETYNRVLTNLKVQGNFPGKMMTREKWSMNIIVYEKAPGHVKEHFKNTVYVMKRAMEDIL